MVVHSDSSPSLREIMAMLVAYVYIRDASRLSKLVMSGYRDDRVEKYCSSYWEPMKSQHIPKKSDLKALGIAIYRRRPLLVEDSAPRLVIVSRGTLWDKIKDLQDDVRISCMRLSNSVRVKRCQTLIENVIKEFLEEDGSKVDQICMAGHSLGAAVLFVVGKHLAESGIVIDTYLFALPRYTVLRFVYDLFKSNTGDLGHKWLKYVAEYAKMHRMVMLNGWLGFMYWLRFVKLRNWVPKLFLNRHDVICNGNIKYYNKWVSATRDNFPMDGVPSADLIISECPFEAHSLKQWYQRTDEGMGLELRSVRLLAECTDEEIRL